MTPTSAKQRPVHVKQGLKPPKPRPQSAAIKNMGTDSSLEFSLTDDQLESPTSPPPSKLKFDDSTMAEDVTSTPDAESATVPVTTPVSIAKDKKLIRITSKPDLFPI